MRFINKLLPNFLIEFDKKLLLNNPVSWVLKLHYFLFWQLILSILMLGFSFILPQSLGDFPAYGFIIVVFALVEILLYLLWTFVSFQFDLRTRNVGKPKLFEQYRIGSHFLVILIGIINLSAVHFILHNNTSKIVEPLNYMEWSKISSDINDFDRNAENYANGYYWEYRYDTIDGRQYRDTIPYHPDTIMARCTRIGALNVIYGDGIRYSGDEVYTRITDSTYFYFEENGAGYYKSRDHFFEILYDNEYHVSASFRNVTFFWNEVYDAIIPYWFVICSILTVLLLLIYSFKFFGIYQLITAILSPTLLFILLAIFAFVLDEFLGFNFNNSLLGYTIVLLLLTAIIISTGFNHQYSSKKRIVFIQTLPLLIPFVFSVFYFEIFHDYITCYSHISPTGALVTYNCDYCISNPDYSDCTEFKKLFQTLWASALGFIYLFVMLALMLKLNYRQYFLPWEK